VLRINSGDVELDDDDDDEEDESKEGDKNTDRMYVAMRNGKLMSVELNQILNFCHNVRFRPILLSQHPSNTQTQLSRLVSRLSLLSSLFSSVAVPSFLLLTF